MNTIKLTTKEQTFVSQYFETALWADFQDDAGIESLDDDCVREGTIDALCFYSRAEMFLSDDNYPDAAHTFYLVRQGHGVAFSDNPHLYVEYVTKKLQALAESFGAVDYYTKDGHLINQGMERVE
jgi:hypothetical protein